MIDGSPYDRVKAFALSKLCIVTLTCMLDYRLEKQGREIVANCFCPSIAPFFGNKKKLSFFSGRRKSKENSTISWAGGALAYMAEDDTTGIMGGQYWRGPLDGKKGKMYEMDFKPRQMNQEASDELNQMILWKLSARLVGANDDEI